jgi:ABC-type nitrate/sulfonate/bicarbonate transport system substrate-binding protein
MIAFKNSGGLYDMFRNIFISFFRFLRVGGFAYYDIPIRKCKARPAILLILIIAMMGLISCNKPKSSLTTINFAVLSPGIGTAYLEFARDQGVFAKRNIDLKIQYFLGGGNEGNSAIASGQIDAGTYGPPVLTAIVRGLKIKIIGSTSDTISDGSILAGRPSIKKVEDLKGKVIATTTKGMSPYQHTFTILEHHGLKASDVLLRPAQGNVGMQLLKAGQADAAILGELDLGIALKNGFAHPLDTSGKYLGAYQSNFIFASQKLIDQKPAVVSELVSALVEANQLVTDDFERYFAYVKKTYGKAYDSTQLSNYLKKTHGIKNLDFRVYPSAVHRYLELMVKWEDFKQVEVDSLKDSRLYDLRFLPPKVNQ